MEWSDRHEVDEHGCWIWQGRIEDNGYGRRRHEGVYTTAHRAYYQHYVGPIPDGLQLDHRCRVRACVNPGHLEPVTPSENFRRTEASGRLGAAHRAKTTCPQGHPYDYVRPSDGARMCRRCKADAVRKHRSRRRTLKQSG